MIKLYPTGCGLSAIVGPSKSQVTKIVEATTSTGKGMLPDKVADDFAPF